MPDTIFYLLQFEVVVTLILFVFLFMKIIDKEWEVDALLKIINGLLLVNVLIGFLGIYFNPGEVENELLFNGMFHSSRLVMLEKSLLNIATLVISLQSYAWLKMHDQVLEFYILLLASLLGMFCMISSGNLLMFYVGFELSTIPIAALANFDLKKKQSSESAMKLIMSSAFSSAFLLFGISFIYGSVGSLDFAEITQRLDAGVFQRFAFIFFLAGILFKISVVPFHLWAADVYQGAPVAITAFLSVVSKAAVFFTLVPILYTVFKALTESWLEILVILSILTMLVANLFALRQENMKRLLAFSSIAQVGFILVGVIGHSQAASASVVYFILVYIFSNLGAFGVIAVMSSLAGKEDLSAYKGLHRTNPALAWVLAISLFSLAGIPPTAGFFGKFFLLIAGAAHGNYVLIAIAALNMVISLYYYLRVVKTMFIDQPATPAPALIVSWMPKTALVICVAGMVLTGLISWFYNEIFLLSPAF